MKTGVVKCVHDAVRFLCEDWKEFTEFEQGYWIGPEGVSFEIEYPELRCILHTMPKTDPGITLRIMLQTLASATERTSTLDMEELKTSLGVQYIPPEEGSQGFYVRGNQCHSWVNANSLHLDWSVTLLNIVEASVIHQWVSELLGHKIGKMQVTSPLVTGQFAKADRDEYLRKAAQDPELLRRKMSFNEYSPFFLGTKDSPETVSKDAQVLLDIGATYNVSSRIMKSLFCPALKAYETAANPVQCRGFIERIKIPAWRHAMQQHLFGAS